MSTATYIDIELVAIEQIVCLEPSSEQEKGWKVASRGWIALRAPSVLRLVDNTTPSTIMGLEGSTGRNLAIVLRQIRVV